MGYLAEKNRGMELSQKLMQIEVYKVYMCTNLQVW